MSCQFPACQAQAKDYCYIWYLDNPKEKLSIDSTHTSPYQIILGSFQGGPGTGSIIQPSPSYPAVIIKWLVLTHPLGSFVVHFKLACLLTSSQWPSETVLLQIMAEPGVFVCCTKEHHTKETPSSRWRTGQTKGRRTQQEDQHFWCKMYHENIFQQLAERVIFNQ